MKSTSVSVVLLITLVIFFYDVKAQTITPSQGNGVVCVFYYSSWTTAYIHYNDGYGWTTPPGIVMPDSTNSSYPSPSWKYSCIVANSFTFLFNNGAGTWDHGPVGGNYQVDAPGVYVVKGGQLTALAKYSVGCAGTPVCYGRGTCSSNVCTCTANYFGLACQGQCACTGTHGLCNGGTFGNGTCSCTPPYGSCGTKDDCSIDFSTNTSNCGGCGIPCKVGPGVSSAVCSNGTCKLQCQSGYVLCAGTPPVCQQGTTCTPSPLPGCDIFTDNQCAGDNINTSSTFEIRRWYTPAPGQTGYLSSYQDYWRVVAWPHVEYNAAMTQATVQINTIHKNGTTVTYKYTFGGNTQASNTFVATTAITGPLTLSITGSDGSHLDLEPLDFVWNAPPITLTQGDYRNGQKGAIVEMFGWPHAEIEKECQTLSSLGYLGVKAFPVTEQVMSYQPFQNVINPWYFMYQPVSYKLQGRMGTRDDLRQMIQTCRKYNVRVYADAVINHMTGSGNDANPFHRNNQGGCTTWPNKTTSNPNPSPYYTQGYTYTYSANSGQPPLQEFPAVPYGPTDFHCERVLNAWNDPLDLNAGWLTGLVDLNTEKVNVQERIADYLTDLIGIGFSGFRIDAAKHIKPDDLVAILSKFKRNVGGTLPKDFITWLEVLLGGEAQMLMCNENSGYNYGQYLANALSAAGFSDTDVVKVKIWNSGYPKEPDADCGSVPKTRDVVQNDDADQQNSGSTSRDMGDQGCVLIEGCAVDVHRGFEVKLFQNPNGVVDNVNNYPIRMILSSFYWASNGGDGIPDGWSDCTLCTTTCSGCETTTFSAAYNANSCGYDTPTYTRVHRDKTIVLAMRAWMNLPTSVTNAQLGLPASCT